MPKAISVSGRAAPATAIDGWIARTLAADPPRARSLIVTVWGDALAPHGGTLWLRGLIGLMGALGVAERSVRTGIYRLAADGWLRGAARGRESRYRLTATGKRAFADAYRRIYFPHADDWTGQWQIVIAAPESVSARERAALRDTLAWHGFGALAPGVFARPHGAHRDAIPLAPSTLARLTVVSAYDDTRVAGTPLATGAANAFGLERVGVAYRTFLARYGRGIELFRDGRRPSDTRQCFVARSLLIHAFRRVLLRDPLLPRALLPHDWPGTAAYALTRDFYRLVHRPADEHLAATLGADFGTVSGDFRRRFGGVD